MACDTQFHLSNPSGTETSWKIDLLQVWIKSRVEMIAEIASFLKSSTQDETERNKQRVALVYEDLEKFMQPLMEKHGESLNPHDLMLALKKAPELSEKLDSLEKDSIFPESFSKWKS